MKQAQWKIDSEIGPLFIVASEKGLQSIHWKKKNIAFAASLDEKSPAVQILKQTVKELNEYFSGRRKNFDITLDVQGTEFQKQVWKQLSRIPYGETLAYKDIAKKIKNEKAMRAVGSANGKNPVAIIVPCHRVIAADGTLGGYAGGLRIKTQLLNLEKAKFSA